MEVVCILKLILNTGNTVLFTVFQLILGYLLAFILFRLKSFSMKNLLLPFQHSIIIIPVCAIVGAVLPLNTFGLIPIIATLAALGLRSNIAIPLVISNGLFNMTSPFTEVSFLWNQAPERIMIAILAGTIAGIIFTKTNLEKKNLIRLQLLNKLGDTKDEPKNLGTIISNGLYILGPFIIIGSLGNTLLLSHWLEWFKTLLYGSSMGMKFVATSARLNLFNSVFIIALSIFTTLINPLFISATAVIFKLKGIIRLYIYDGLIFLLLSLSLFIK